VSAGQSQSPQPFRWDGDAMIPLRPRAADRQYVIGQVYTLEEREERSSARHRAFFAQIRECWQSLPEEIAGNFPNDTALRKKALIRTGWCDTRTEAFRSNAEARRAADLIAQFMAPDEFAEIVVCGTVLVVMRAKSQACNAMDRKTFDQSSEAVLKYLADLLGVDAASLPRTEAA
jgi:hypothetical protein